MCQTGIDVGRVETTEEVHVAFITLLAMVGNIDHDGLALFEALHDLIHDGVVIEDGVVIVGQDAALPRVEVGFDVYVIVALEMFAVFRTALSVDHMLANEVEDGEVMVTLLRLQLVIVFEQALVEDMQLVVARVKLCRTELRVVEEEAATEIVDRLLGFGQELVREERHMIAGLTEQLGEERIVAPLALLSHNMHGEKVLEHKAREVPWCHHVCKLDETPRALTLLLAWRGGHDVAIL